MVACNIGSRGGTVDLVLGRLDSPHWCSEAPGDGEEKGWTLVLSEKRNMGLGRQPPPHHHRDLVVGVSMHWSYGVTQPGRRESIPHGGAHNS